MALIRANENQCNVSGMARYGIKAKKIYGLSTPTMRGIAKAVGKDHALALELWGTEVYEARIIACVVDVPGDVTESQMEHWAGTFDSWALCDTCCMNLFDRTKFAYQKAREWSQRDEEFVKRAGFALMATLAIHDKKVSDEPFIGFLDLVKAASNDDRAMAMKGANWALRQIGKRNLALNRLAIDAAKEIAKIGSKSAKWIASDALRELEGEIVQERLRRWERKRNRVKKK